MVWIRLACPAQKPRGQQPAQMERKKNGRLESVRIGKCQNPFFAHFEQNWKVSELESVRIGKCQNRGHLSWPTSRVGKWPKVRVGKLPTHFLAGLESGRHLIL